MKRNIKSVFCAITLVALPSLVWAAESVSENNLPPLTSLNDPAPSAEVAKPAASPAPVELIKPETAIDNAINSPKTGNVIEEKPMMESKPASVKTKAKKASSKKSKSKKSVKKQKKSKYHTASKKRKKHSKKKR